MATDAEPSHEAAVHDAEPAGPGRLGTAERVVLAVLPLSIAVVYLGMAIALPPFSHDLPLKPSAFPINIGVSLAIVGVAITICAATGLWHIDDAQPAAAVGSWRDTAAGTVAIAAFVVGFENIGFALGAFLLVATLATATAPTKWVRNIIAALVFAAACQYVFGELLSVRLPSGLLWFVL